MQHGWSAQRNNKPYDGSCQGKAGRDTIIKLSDKLQIQIIVDSTWDCFREDLLSFNINQIVFWDEMHKEQFVGYSGVISAGRFDPINGKIVAEASAILHTK